MKEPHDIWGQEELVDTLASGGVVVMPTDTVYGIVGKALDSNTVQHIYSARKRSPEKPCIILIGNIASLAQFGIELSEQQRDILQQHWPGPVSIIVDCPHEQFHYLHRGTNSLAFRLPSSNSLQELLLCIGPLIAPSANTEGSPVATTIAEARDYFDDQVDLYVDGGTVIGSPSRILKAHPDNTVTIIRS